MLCNGEYGRAISTFSTALRILKQLLALEGTGSDSVSYDPSSMDLSISFIEAESSSYQHEDDEPSHFVFQKPIVVMALDFEKYGSNTPAKLSAIMIFNFALAHHLSAMKHKNNYSHLHIALRLYAVAYLQQQNEQAEICTLYTLALSNNLGQVLNATKHISKANQCFEQLLSKLLLVLEYCDDEEKRNIRCFFRSASSCILGNINMAPAA